MAPQTVTLSSPDGDTVAEFAPEANMVCRSLQHRGAEWLEQRLGLDAYVQQGKTMGIPLLHPWANRLATLGYAIAGKEVSLPQGDPRIRLDGDRPIHGVMPAFLNWKLVEPPGRSSVKAKLSWTAPELLEVFPFTHELELRASVGDGHLTMDTTLYATGSDPVPVAFGYHPYLRIPDSSRTDWHIQLGAFRRLVLDDRMIPTGERQPVDQRSVDLGDSSWDDAFDGLTTHARFEAATAESSVEVEFLRGYAFAQVFAPPGTNYICFEPMTAPANALNSRDGLHVIAPGEDYRTGFRIKVSG